MVSFSEYSDFPETKNILNDIWCSVARHNQELILCIQNISNSQTTFSWTDTIGISILYTRSRQDPGGPHVGPMNLAIWGSHDRHDRQTVPKVHGAKMGPTWVISAPEGPHVGPTNFAIGGASNIGLVPLAPVTSFTSGAKHRWAQLPLTV